MWKYDNNYYGAGFNRILLSVNKNIFNFPYFRFISIAVSFTVVMPSSVYYLKWKKLRIYSHLNNEHRLPTTIDLFTSLLMFTGYLKNLFSIKSVIECSLNHYDFFYIAAGSIQWFSFRIAFNDVTFINWMCVLQEKKSVVTHKKQTKMRFHFERIA